MATQSTDRRLAIGASRSDDLAALPARYYVEDQVLARERERIFFKAWQYAGHASELSQPGDYVTTEILGQNIFVVVDRDGELNAFYNVCRHRGHKLLEGAGRKQVIVCPYHQWSYGLDGELVNNRATATSRTADKAQICLYPVRVDRLLDFVLVNLDPDAEPIAQYWPGLEAEVLAACPEAKNYALSDSASALHPVEVQANWKIQVDNFLECFHCRAGHDTFCDLLDVANQRQTLYRNYSYSFIPSSGKVDSRAYPLDPEHDVMDMHFWHLFPNLGLGIFAGPGNLSLSQWNPLGPHRAYRRIVQLDNPEVTDPGMLERRARRTAWGRDVLQPEDISFIESVHQGMSQRCFDHGWYLIDPGDEEISEVMLRHFHQTYLAQMGD